MTVDWDIFTYIYTLEWHAMVIKFLYLKCFRSYKYLNIYVIWRKFDVKLLAWGTARIDPDIKHYTN